MSNRWDIHWKDYYQILQVHPTSGQEVIKVAYDRLARKYHPDVNQEPSSTQKMKDINEAFEVLGALETRRLYHPDWLQKRRESNNRQAPPRASARSGTYERPGTYERSETPVRPTSSKPRIPTWGKWAIGLAVGWFVIAVVIPNLTSSSQTPTTKIPTPTTSQSPVSVRLPTGPYLLKNLAGGYGELKIDNGLDLDSISVLSRIEAPKIPLMQVYIRAGASYTITGISDGVYLLSFMCLKWDDDSKKFTEISRWQRFKDEFDFNTTSDQYMTWEVTLNPVIGGTAQAEYLGEGEFPVLIR